MSEPHMPIPGFGSEDLKHVMLNGIEFHYFDYGSGEPVFCLHGFPDTPHSFQKMVPALLQAGYRVILPYTRGYYPTSPAPDGDYSVARQAEDIVALISSLAGGRARVIGHDWGGMAAYTAANMCPHLIDQLVVISAPHLHNAPFSLAQLFRSWYVMYFQIPYVPQRLAPLQDFALIERLYKQWSPSWHPVDYDLRPVKECFKHPASIEAAIGYYRSMVNRTNKVRWQLMSKRTAVPALVIHGAEDGGVGAELLANVRECYSYLDDFMLLPETGHFPHREKAHEVNQRVLQFFSTGYHEGFEDDASWRNVKETGLSVE